MDLQQKSDLFYEDAMDHVDVGVTGDWCDALSVNRIEWTHGGSEFLSGVDLPVYIDSTPEDTLHRRVKRNRDENAASELIKTVLDIEQKKLLKQAKNAKIVVGRDGGIYEQ